MRKYLHILITFIIPHNYHINLSLYLLFKNSPKYRRPKINTLRNINPFWLIRPLRYIPVRGASDIFPSVEPNLYTVD